MLRVDPVADREKGLWSAARDADCASWLRPKIRGGQKVSKLSATSNVGISN